MHDLLGTDFPGGMQGQALPAIFVNDYKHTKVFSIGRAALHKIICPDVVFPLRTQPDAGKDRGGQNMVVLKWKTPPLFTA